jgi:hypothetical protein
MLTLPQRILRPPALGFRSFKLIDPLAQHYQFTHKSLLRPICIFHPVPLEMGLISSKNWQPYGQDRGFICPALSAIHARTISSKHYHTLYLDR